MLPAEMPTENYAVRLRAPYDSLRQCISRYAMKAEKVVVYEHPEEGNIHCHLLLYGVRDTADNLKKILWEHVSLKGGGQLSYKTTFKDKITKTVHDVNDETIPKYITYMSKGKYEPKYFTGYDKTFIDDCKSQWVEHKRRSADEILYISFVKFIWEKEKEFSIKIISPADIKKSALIHAKQKYGVINLGCRRDVKMLVDTYLYENCNLKASDIKLPFE